MLEFQTTEKFEKQLKNVSTPLRRTFFKNLKLFLANKKHPSLHTEKLIEPFYSFRINDNFRAIFYYVNTEKICFAYIANHNIYKKIQKL